MPDLLPSIELETAPGPSASVICLHGLGADGNDFEALIAREKARGVLAAWIVLAGSSQGGAIALYTGFRPPSRSPGRGLGAVHLPGAGRPAAGRRGGQS